MRSRYSFYVFKVPVIYTISLSRIIQAKSEATARDIFWNEHFHPRIRGFKWPGRHFEIREITPEERIACLEEAVVEVVD